MVYVKGVCKEGKQLLNGQNKWIAIGNTSPLKLHFKCQAIYMLNKAASQVENEQIEWS